MMAECQYVQLSKRGVVTVTGDDRKEFLQGLISNDIEQVGPDCAIWAALLTPQGKYLHDFFVFEMGDMLYLDCEADRLMDLGKRLHRYKLRAQVELGIAEAFSVFALIGESAPDLAGLGVDPGSARRLDDGIVYVDPRLPQVGVRALLPSTSAIQTIEALGFTPTALDTYDLLRLELGLSDGSRDLVIEKSTLLESNFDDLRGVDWNKGCYMGQELTARTKYRGLVRKRLMPVIIDGPLPEHGTPVMAGGKEIGEMRSSFEGRGLALIRLERLDEAGNDALVAGEANVMPEKPGWATY
jgi:folate-binding protein YgfZ